MIEIYLGLLHFRKNLDGEFLAAIFELSTRNSSGVSTAFNIKDRTLDFFVSWVGQFYPSFSREERLQHQYTIGNKCIVLLLDGTEQRVVKPTSSFMSSIFWSSKKKQFSINKLIGVTVDGLIVWMSDSHPGRIVDSEIVERELFFLTEGWDDHELILADQGFEGNGFFLKLISMEVILNSRFRQRTNYYS